MSLESDLSNLLASIGELDDAVTDNTDVLRDAVSSLNRLASVLVQNNKETDPLGGFKPGDVVLYFDSVYTEGLKGTVEDHGEGKTYTHSVPVKRSDNGRYDRFPVRGTILESAVKGYKPVPRTKKWYDDKPGFGETQKGWNTRLARAAASEGLTLEFMYEKPSVTSYGYPSTEPAKQRTCRVERFTETGNPAITGTDVEADLGGRDPIRQFRIDRMRSYAKVINDD